VGYRGVIFDVDGTLVDSNDAHAQAWVEAFEQNGQAVPFERVRPLVGMGGDKLIPAACGLAADSPEGEAISAQRGDIFRERFLPRIEAFAGARQLLAALKERGFRLGVASSAQEDELGPLLRIAGASGLLETKTSKDDAASSKPDPDIVAVALQRLRCAPQEALMIGDTPYDVEAAQRAGVACIGFRCGGWDDEQLAGAMAVFSGPWALLRRLDDSPLRDAAR
jgi:HAD superfamily hydrolase (TIGR01509 family)